MHQSENPIPLDIVNTSKLLTVDSPDIPNVEVILLPFYKNLESIPGKESLYSDLNNFISSANGHSTIAILSSPIFAVDFCTQLKNDAHLKLWIAVRLTNEIVSEGALTQNHCSLLILTRYKGSLNHTKTRIGYTFCPFCDKTTKDYGGKKHLYHEFGTLVSDVWRDISVDFEKYPSDLIFRIKDLFGVAPYKNIIVRDQRKSYPAKKRKQIFKLFQPSERLLNINSKLVTGDCIEQLEKVPDSSIDFCFADPPYNIQKKYESWDDGIDIQDYFAWCDNWLNELARVLKPGGTLAILNIPLWCIRHFKHLNMILDFQDWIVWEGLGMPVRMIMPSHYSILCFSKGKPDPLPGLIRKQPSIFEANSISSLKEDFCIRGNCKSKRKRFGVIDKEIATNLWWDIHRIKHNSCRVDHPCQLPPMFMYRLISLFTNENQIVLDPFNGAGTTTITAKQLNRKYIGIELSDYYNNITTQRHKELDLGLDPFRKIDDSKPKAKNSRVVRIKKQKYNVSKKILQMEIKMISKHLGHIPSKEEVTEHSKYPLKYYESYFTGWREVTAAARTTGMSENRPTIQ